ncbi:MAG: VOC family protein [Pseudonocardia sp.]|nr:VOC family protein [Pseudonocardia sp.]
MDCHDDQGLSFAVFVPLPGAPAPRVASEFRRPGELSYDAVHVPDGGRAVAFYGSVLGWEFTPGRSPGNWNVQVDGGNPQPMIGLSERPELDRPVIVPMFTVADAYAAADAVRAAGGTAEEPEDAGYATSALCTDDQGGQFWIAQF